MSWFRREAVDERDPQLPLEVREADPRVVVMDFGEKPDDLVRAANMREWTRPPRPPDPLTVDWIEGPPTQAGVYWFVEWGPSATVGIRQCVVLDFGGRLCVRQRRGDACKYTAVVALRRHWAGPIATPNHVALEDLDAEGGSL